MEMTSEEISGFYKSMIGNLKVADQYHQEGKCFSEHKQLYAILKTLTVRMTYTANCIDFETESQIWVWCNF